LGAPDELGIELRNRMREAGARHLRGKKQGDTDRDPDNSKTFLNQRHTNAEPRLIYVSQSRQTLHGNSDTAERLGCSRPALT